MNRIRSLVLGLSLLTVAWAREGGFVLQAPPRALTRTNPLEGQERARRAGAKLFARECAECHGSEGQGGVGKAPPLEQPEVYDAAAGALFWVLRNGSLQRGMPSFAHLPEPERWQIVTYLKSFRPR